MTTLQQNTSGLLSTLWNLAIGLIQNISKLWDWLNTPIDLNFQIFGFTVGLPTFTPILLLSTGLTIWVVWIVIKNLVPGL